MPAPQGRSSDAVEARHLPWSSAADDLRKDWQGLVDRLGFNFTLGPAFVEIAARCFDKLDRLQVFCEFRDGHLCTVIPYFRSVERTWGMPLRTLHLASNLMSYHPEIVTDCDPLATVNRFLASIGAWDVLSAATLSVDGPTARALARWADASGSALLDYAGDESPYLAIEADWASYLADRPKKFRYKIRRHEEQIGPRGTFSLRWFRTRDEANELLDAILAIEPRSWKGRLGVDITSHPWEVAFYRNLLPAVASAGELLGAVLYSETRPVAYSLCVVHNRWVGQVKTSFDESFDEFSPGAVVIKESIQWAFESGASEFDFLGHTDRHKRAWTERSRQHVNYFVYSRRPRALVLGGLKALKHRLSPPAQQHPVKPEHA